MTVPNKPNSMTIRTAVPMREMTAPPGASIISSAAPKTIRNRPIEPRIGQLVPCGT